MVKLMLGLKIKDFAFVVLVNVNDICRTFHFLEDMFSTVLVLELEFVELSKTE